MAWPTTRIPTDDMDQETDRPPREDIKAIADAVNSILAEHGVSLATLVGGHIPAAQMQRGEAGGVASLDATRKVPIEELPASVAGSGRGLQYQWSGTRLRVRNNDGTWSPYVDLRGPAGPRGVAGPAGPAVAPDIQYNKPVGRDQPIRMRIGISGQWSDWVTIGRTSACFPLDQRILTVPRAWRAVADIRIGDVLAIPTSLAGRPVVALDGEVLATEIAEICLTGGVLRCTPNHPVRVIHPRGWQWAAVRPNPQTADRRYWATVAVDGDRRTRELWRRGQREDECGPIRPLEVGDRLVMAGPARLDSGLVIEIRTRQEVCPVATPVTGGHVIVEPGVVCSGGWSQATEAASPDRVREIFRVAEVA